VSYFRPENAREIAPRSVCSLPNSTQKVSQKGGRVSYCKCAQEICLTARVHPKKLGPTWVQQLPN
jgi:hypothetical protein